jgi:lysophospholipase L1-like esterase
MIHRPRCSSSFATFLFAGSVAVTAFAAHAEAPATVQIAAMPMESRAAVKTVAPASALPEKNTAADKTAATPATVGAPAVPAATTASATATAERAAAGSPRCSAPAELTQLGRPLNHTARLLAAGSPIKIVAIGSSSTAGAGASSPAASYPNRLAVELSQRFPGVEITVLNRGVNGEEAADMLARFDTAVIAEKPDLVLWQVGTNGVLRDQPLPPASSLIEEGLARIKAIGADAILIDPQYAPKVIAKTGLKGMISLIATAAKRSNVGFFQRFAVMRSWHERDGMDFDAFVSPDQLHMNDWSYACVAKVLGAAIAEAATRPTASAAVQSPR